MSRTCYILEHVFLKQLEDELIETLNEIYTLCGVKYIALGVLLIDSPMWMWKCGGFLSNFE